MALLGSDVLKFPNNYKKHEQAVGERTDGNNMKMFKVSQAKKPFSAQCSKCWNKIEDSSSSAWFEFI